MSKDWKSGRFKRQLSDLEKDIESIIEQLRVEQNPVTRNRLEIQLEQRGELLDKTHQQFEQHKMTISETLNTSQAVDKAGVQHDLVATHEDIITQRAKSHFKTFKSAAILSLFITGGVILIRFTGLFEAVELQLFDHILRSRAAESSDPRIVIVEATEKDLTFQREKGEVGIGSVSDKALDEVLRKVNQAKVIALDLYRDFDQSQDPIADRMRDIPQLVGICEQPNIDNERGIDPPSEFVTKTENVGFTNFLLDDDKVLRRQLLIHQNPDNEHLCKTDEAFGLLVALRFLQSTTGLPGSDEQIRQPTGDLIFKEGFSIERIDSFEYAGYRDLEVFGIQSLINYRDSRNTLREIAPHYSMQSIRSGSIPESFFKDKIVIIGLTAPSEAIDYVQTPYQEEVSGVTIHAHIVSQIISYVLDGRPLLWVFPQWQEAIFILTGAGVGVCIAIFIKSRKSFLLSITGGSVSIYVLSLSLIRIGGWLPLLPILFAFLLSTTVVRFNRLSTTI